MPERVQLQNLNTPEYWHEQYKNRPEQSDLRITLVAELIRRSGARTVLDIGCGLGEVYGALLKENTACDFFGTDFSTTAIERNKAKYPKAQWLAEAIGKSCLALQSFDCVVSCEVLEHMEDPLLLVYDLKRFVKPTGTIIITTPLKNRINSAEHVWSYSEEDIKEYFPEPEYKVMFCREFPAIIVAYITVKK